MNKSKPMSKAEEKKLIDRIVEQANKISKQMKRGNSQTFLLPKNRPINKSFTLTLDKKLYSLSSFKDLKYSDQISKQIDKEILNKIKTETNNHFNKSQRKASKIMKFTKETISKIISKLKKNKPIESVDDAIPIKKNSIFYHIKEFITKEYSQNVESLLKSVSMFLSSTFITKYVKNKKLKFLINAISFIITSGLIIFEIFIKIQHYLFELRNDEEDMNESFHDKCVNLYNEHFGVIDSEMYDICSTKYNPQNEKVIDWLLTNPKSDLVKIEAIYDIEKNEKLSFHDLDTGLKDTGFFMRVGEYKFLWVLSTIAFQQKIRVTSATMYYCDSDDINLGNIGLILSQEYVRSLNYSDNVFFFSDSNYLDIKPRCGEIKYNINQFDVNSFINEITGILKKGGRRSYAFVGKPGVGKSQILRTIENKVKDFMIFHLTSKDFNKGNFKDVLGIIKSFSPIIVIIEDLDSCNVKTKNYRVGEFINWLDESNLKNAIVLTSINNTKLVNSTILRPGRTDMIVEISSPKSVKEIHEVLISKINVVKDKYNFNQELTFEYLKDFLDVCLKNEYTQSEISNLLDQFFIDYDESKDILEVLNLSIEKYEHTKMARKKYYDNDEEYDDNSVKSLDDDC